MRYTANNKSILTAVCLAGILLAGCNSVDPRDPQFKLEVSAPPETLLVGSPYVFRYAWSNAASSASIHVSLSDSTLDSLTISAISGALEFQWRARPRMDTVRLSVVAANGGDTAVRIYHPAYATGFAPIASTEIQRFTYTSYWCCLTTGGGSSTSEVTLTPLGPMDSGFRFERKYVGSVNSTDTLLLKMSGNLVMVRTNNIWAPVNRVAFPYFVQDTISGELAPEATRENAVGYLGKQEYQEGRGTYKAGVGLIEFGYVSLIQMRGADGYTIKRL